MGRYKLLVLVLALVRLLGCTPTSESVVRKAGQVRTEVPFDQRSSVSGYCVLGTDRLPDPATRAVIASYGSTIRQYSREYGFDWRLVVAVMRVESGFSTTAESDKGATGLMQIMPTTGEEVGQRLDIEDMAHPLNNIKGGVYYLARLYRLFGSSEQTDRIKLTLAAYNAGIGRIYDAQELAAYLHENPARWSAVRDALPLLSKRYYTLHSNVWAQDKPKSGWFGNPGETIAYVDKVMKWYDEYREVLD